MCQPLPYSFPMGRSANPVAACADDEVDIAGYELRNWLLSPWCVPCVNNVEWSSISAIFAASLPPYGLAEPSAVVRIGNLKRFMGPLRNLMVHMIESGPRSGCTGAPIGTTSA